MKRNAIIRIVLWGTALLVLLAILFILIYVPGTSRRLRNDPPAETMVPVALPRVTSPSSEDSYNAITTDDLNVRNAPDEHADAVAFAERGTFLNILRQETIGSKQWGYIGAPNQGWVDMESVDFLVELPDHDQSTLPQEEGSYNAFVLSNALNVRSMPSSDAPVAGMLEGGTFLLITKQELVNGIDWGYISTPVNGWIVMEYVELLSPVEERNETADVQATLPEEEAPYNALVLANALNVRSMPSSEAPTAGILENGTHLLITKQELVNGTAWGYISTPVNGWIRMEYVKLLTPIEENNTAIDIPVQQDAQILGHGVSLDAASIRDMEIEWAAGTVIIQPEDIQQIYIREETTAEKHEQMIWHVREGKVSIQYSENTDHNFGMGLLLGSESKDLIIQVPLDWQCNSLEIDAASASLEVNHLTIREMEFDGASGTCVFNNCTVESLELDTASGDVCFQGSLDQMDCDAASANVVLELSNVPRSLEMDTASGDLDVILPQDAGFTVTMDTMGGNFESDFTTTQRNKSYVAGDGRCRIEVDAMSGDVTIRKGA